MDQEKYINFWLLKEKIVYYNMTNINGQEPRRM